MVSGEASKRSAYWGRIGNTMPKPIRSTATVVQIVPNPRGSGSRCFDGFDDDRATAASERDRGTTVKSGARPGCARDLLRTDGSASPWPCPRPRTPSPRARPGADRPGPTPSPHGPRRVGGPGRRPRRRATRPVGAPGRTRPTATVISRTVASIEAAVASSSASRAWLPRRTRVNRSANAPGVLRSSSMSRRNSSSAIGIGLRLGQFAGEGPGELVEAPQGRRGVVGGGLGDLHRRPVVAPQHQQPDRPADRSTR